MNRKLYAYSLIRTLYDKGKDYIDSFWPLTVRVFPADQASLTETDIQSRLQDRYGLYVPIHSVKIILTRAKRNELLTQERGRYLLTPEGIKYASALEDERDVERRINELSEDLRTFLSKGQDTELSAEDVRGLLESFVREHTEILGIFLSPGDYDAKRDDVWSSKALKAYEPELVRYCEESESRRPAIYGTLREIVCGSIISSTLGSQSLAEASKQFKRTTLFLDSNFMFSLLGLHDPHFSKPAQELFGLVKEAGRFDLRVFDFTVEEMVQVLKAYQNEHHMYVPHIKVNSIYSSMKGRGLSPSDVLHFIARLEEKINQVGVMVHATTVRLCDYEPRDSELRARLLKYKPLQGGRGQNHDLAAIEKVQELRRGQVRQLENAGALFVSSDMRLARYDLVEHGHRDRATIVEVIPDRLLTNVLWLKNPGTMRALPLGTIIAAHSRQLFIDREVWGVFYRAVRDLKEKGSINDEDISLLLYDQRLQDMLREVRHEDAERAGQQLVLEALPEVRKRVEETAHKMAKEQESRERAQVVEMAKAAFTEEMSRRDMERNQRIIDQIGESKQRMKDKARHRGGQAHMAIRIVAVCALIGASMWAAPFAVQWWPQFEPLAWLAAIAVPLILAACGIRYDPMGLSDKLRDRLVALLYRKYLETADLDRLVSDLTK